MTDRLKIDAARAYAQAFERLAPENLDALIALVDEKVVFRDPFNRTEGKAAFRRIFAHMFTVCEAPRFTVSDIAPGENAVYLCWRMTGRLRSWPRAQFTLDGMSEIHIDRAGLVTAHIDHWDSASQLLSRLPGIGIFIRMILRLFRQPPAAGAG